MPETAFVPQCPFPIQDYPRVLMAHGGGGRLMQHLLAELVRPALGEALLEEQHDGAVLPQPGGRIAFTTDSFVVQPIFFPGGDIGSLAVHGTVNDLAMCGARPRYLSVGLILEEGLPMETLWRVLCSMRAAAEAAGVRLVTGDTKVVERRGAGSNGAAADGDAPPDGLFINTSGVGVVEGEWVIAPQRIRAGDAVLLSGDIGRHGTAVLSVRENLGFETALQSDSAPLAEAVQALLEAGVDVHCLRDCTRGGLGAALIELAGAAGLGMVLEEAAVPVPDAVQGACELMGLDPLFLANEGRFVAILPESEAERALAALRAVPEAAGACRVGTVTSGPAGRLSLRTAYGPERVVDLISGEQLPRIC